MFKIVHRNFIKLLAIVIVIGSWCLIVQAAVLDQLTPNPANDRVYKNYLNVSNYSGDRCDRECVAGNTRKCYFNFNLEYYQSMGLACGQCEQGVDKDCNRKQCVVGDGFKKGVMSINRQIPGPPIYVCKDDIVIIDVHNGADGTSAALHWHGVHMIKTPYMDGVPFVTQCPISFSNTFRYQFRATEPGTQFYHSHAGHHKANGQYGTFVIRQPKELEPARALYDHDLSEHHIFISDWMHVYAEQLYPGINTADGIFADSLVVNGRGVYTNPQTLERNRIPPAIFYVTPGRRYRFRLINGLNHACPVQTQIEKHSITVIASDSFNVEPETIETLISNAGERYDFILEANQQGGDFWLRARGLGPCLDRPTESYALLRYTTNENINMNEDVTPIPPFPEYNRMFPVGRLFNHPNATCFADKGNKCLTELTALDYDDALLAAQPDHKFILGFDNYAVPTAEIFERNQYDHFANLFGNLTAVGGINNLSLVFPSYPPLTQPESYNKSDFCTVNTRPAKCDGQYLCHCTHRLKVKLNSIVELIIVDETENVNAVNHPFHLHGYSFVVTGMGQDPRGIPMNVQRAEEMENANQLPRQDLNKRPPRKDTVSIPSRGYVVVRFRATNPGFWLMHCHYEWHLSIGMGVILQVGKRSEMIKPPQNFPKCGNNLPQKKNKPRTLEQQILDLFDKYFKF